MTLSYVPLLKAKVGEFEALSRVSEDVAGVTAPLLEIPPPPYDFANERYSKSPEAHCAALARRIGECSDRFPATLVDLRYLDAMPEVEGLKPLWEILAEEAENSVPVYSLRTDAPNAKPELMLFRCDSPQCALRVDGATLFNANFDQLVMEALDATGHSPDKVWLLADFGPITEREVQLTAAAARTVLPRLAKRFPWYSVTLASGAFPQDLRNVPRGVSRLPRADWMLWEALRNEARFHSFLYGDFGIAHPDHQELDPRIIQPSANIRYTAEREWLVEKGQSIKRQGGGQFQDLAASLMAEPEFSGGTFSEGDAYIEACAVNRDRKGTLKDWRMVGTNHHVTYVVRQLANSGAP